MTKLLPRFLGAAAMLLAAHVAFAAQYPPGPLGTCLDSVSLYQVQNPAAPCHPAVGDTVYGVGGIITGFDPIPTGFAIYIQNSAGGPWSGIDVFTHGTNFQVPMGLAIGDSLVVEVSKLAEFQNGGEIMGPNNNFSAPDIVLRKVSAGNALPAFFESSVHTLREVPTNPDAEQWEGCLVKITDDMHVARTVGLPFGTFLVVSNTVVAAESVLVDGSTLTSFGVPPLNTTCAMVQGIYEQRTRGYRIQLRDGDDISIQTPPGLNDAYSITDTQVRLVYDRSVTPATATDLSNYSLASFGSVDAAVMDGGAAVILTIDNGLAHGILETVTVNNVVGTTNGLAMTSPASRIFVNGVLSTAELSAPNPDSLLGTPCRDKSRFAGGGGQITQGLFGPRATFTGIVVGVFGNLFYMEDDTPANHGGVTVFAPPQPLLLGHRYKVAGATQEFFGETEFAAITYVQDLGAATIPQPIQLTVAVAKRDTCDIAQDIDDGENYECELVKLYYVKVVQRFPPTVPTNGFHVTGENPAFADTMFVENQNAVLGANSASNPNYPALGKVCSITGVVHYGGSSFRVCPRTTADIIVHGTDVGVGEQPRELAFSVYPNPGRNATLAFALPKDADIEIGVFDLAGRQVAEVAKGHFEAGSYSRTWSGTTMTGKTAAPGVYFYRLRMGDEVRNVRAILLGN